MKLTDGAPEVQNTGDLLEFMAWALPRLWLAVLALTALVVIWSHIKNRHQEPDAQKPPDSK
jgi:hypothetical protein